LRKSYLQQWLQSKLMKKLYPEDSWASIDVWNCDKFTLDDDGNKEFVTEMKVAAVFLSKINESSGDKYIVEIEEGEKRSFYIDRYDWTAVNINVDDTGRKIESKELTTAGIQEGWELEYIEANGEKHYVNDTDSQKKVLQILKSNEGMKMKFLQPENENTWGFRCLTCCFSAIGCVPCAWLSFRSYCGLGGHRYSARELITNVVKGTNEYLVDDGDILLVSCANPGWLSLSQGGQWGHCGIIYRYKEKAHHLLPKRFQDQLENWKARGFVEEGTPLVFEMANHGREKDTNDFKVHLSHLQNWHMFHDATNYFGATMGIRKFTGERNREFYLALFQTMHRHHMKPYESVPMEFICSGLCFFPKTPYEEQIKELFCSELVALFFYNLKYAGEDPLIPKHVFPSEFQPADFGETKTCFPFFFMCCCLLSYCNCSEQRQAWRQPLRKYMGELLTLDISSIGEWEDEVKSGQRIEDKGPSYTDDNTSNAFRADCNIDVNDEQDINEIVRRQQIEKMRKESGCGMGKICVEMTWWVFYLFTFPFGLCIRIQTQMDAIKAAEEHRKSEEGNQLPEESYELLTLERKESLAPDEDDSIDRKSGYAHLFVGFLYFCIVLFAFRKHMGTGRMSLWECPLYLYYFSIMLLGVEGVCGNKTRNCYDGMFRCGLRCFRVRLKEKGDYFSKQIAPVKIPFVTSIVWSFAAVLTFILQEIGYKQELEFDFEMPGWTFAGSLVAIVVALYLLCQYIITSAISMASMLEDLQPSPVHTAQTLNAVIEFNRLIEESNAERDKKLVITKSLLNLKTENEDAIMKQEELEKEIASVEEELKKKKALNKDPHERPSSRDDIFRDPIFQIMMRTVLDNLKEERDKAKPQLQKYKDMIAQLEKENAMPKWFFGLKPEEREKIWDRLNENKELTEWAQSEQRHWSTRNPDENDLKKAWDHLQEKKRKLEIAKVRDQCEDNELLKRVVPKVDLERKLKQQKRDQDDEDLPDHENLEDDDDKIEPNVRP